MRFPPLCLAFCAIASSAAAQPANSPAAILSQSRQASGGAAWNRVTELVAHGRMIENGYSGDLNVSIDTRTGRNAFQAQFSTVHATIGTGMDTEQSWTLDQNGDIELHPGADSDRDGSTEMFLARHGYWQPAFSASARVLDPVTESGVTYERVEVTPPNGRIVALWFNSKTHLLDREQWGNSQKLYGDYRQVDRLMLPFSIRYRTGEHEDYRYELQSVRPQQKLDEADFAVPFHHDYTMPASGITSVTSFDGIGVSIRINGKGPFKAFLDTGSINLLSTGLARELGLKPEAVGGKLASEAGTIEVRPVKLTTLVIGDATLHDQLFQTADFPGGPGEPVAVLGFEFLDRFVVKVDYEQNRLTIYDGARFHYNGSGVDVPLQIRSRNLYVNATADGFDGVFAIDTGNEVAFELNRVSCAITISSPGATRAFMATQAAATQDRCRRLTTLAFTNCASVMRNLRRLRQTSARERHTTEIRTETLAAAYCASST